MLRGCSERFDPDDALQHSRRLGVLRGGWDDTGAVIEVYAFGERNILPDLEKATLA